MRRVSKYLPINTNHSTFENPNTSSDNARDIMPALAILTSFRHLPNTFIPRTAPTPCEKYRNADKYPTFSAEKHSGLCNKNSTMTPPTPRVVRTMTPEHNVKMIRFLLAPFLGYLYTYHTLLMLDKLNSLQIIIFLSTVEEEALDSGTKKIVYRTDTRRQANMNQYGTTKPRFSIHRPLVS